MFTQEFSDISLANNIIEQIANVKIQQTQQQQKLMKEKILFYILLKN